MIETLISSKTRVKLLLKFFLNSNTTAYLRNLEEEFGESTNGIRIELNRLENAGMLDSKFEGKKKIYKVNTHHPLFVDINSMVRKLVGIDKIFETIIQRLGDLDKVYVVGSFAKGMDGDIIDLVFIGNVDNAFLMDLIEKAEKKIKRRIRFITYTSTEFDYEKLKEMEVSPLLIWSK